MKQTEKKISKIYSRAEKEIKKKTKDFFETLDKQNKVMLKKLSSGKITQGEYDRWKQGKLLTGEHWKSMSKSVSSELVNASKTAAAYVNGKLPEIYALNYNALGDIVKGYSFELVNASAIRNLATSDKTLLPYKIVNGKKVERWATQKVNAEIMQGIVQGESIPKIAARLGKVTKMDEASSVRNARTTVTSAENKGRLDSYEDAEEQGIILHKIWVATNDGLTRDAHLELDGQEVDIDEPWEVVIQVSKNSFVRDSIMYPGDPDAHPANVYNCRCAMKTKVVGFRQKDGSVKYV